MEIGKLNEGDSWDSMNIAATELKKGFRIFTKCSVDHITKDGKYAKIYCSVKSGKSKSRWFLVKDLPNPDYKAK